MTPRSGAAAVPIYEYECQSCRTSFEQYLKSAADEASVTCPECGTQHPMRIPSVFPARKTEAPAALPQRGCGRCGDPNGPCAAE